MKRDPTFKKAPNSFLIEVTAGIKTGAALDLGMGEGRNSIYLAQHGWDVTGIDLSETGVSSSRRSASASGAKLNALVQDADTYDYGEKRWDLVCIFYFEGYSYVHEIEKRISGSMKKEGHVIMEAPYSRPIALLDRWTAWEPFGYTLLRLEFRRDKADWRQPSFGRLLIRKS